MWHHSQLWLSPFQEMRPKSCQGSKTSAFYTLYGFYFYLIFFNFFIFLGCLNFSNQRLRCPAWAEHKKNLSSGVAEILMDEFSATIQNARQTSPVLLLRLPSFHYYAQISPRICTWRMIGQMWWKWWLFRQSKIWLINFFLIIIRCSWF